MITPGSWWVSKNGQRIAASKLKCRYTRKNSYGCYVEGALQVMLWLTEPEIRASFKPFRPKPDPTKPPSWLAQLPDLIWEPKGEAARWVILGEVKYGWVRLTTRPLTVQVLDVNRILNFEWGLQICTTVFLPLSEALPGLHPRFSRLSAIERIDTGSPVLNLEHGPNVIGS